MICCGHGGPPEHYVWKTSREDMCALGKTRRWQIKDKIGRKELVASEQEVCPSSETSRKKQEESLATGISKDLSWKGIGGH